MTIAEIIYVKLLNEKAKLPCRMSSSSSGADLSACLDKPVIIPPGKYSIIPTGIAVAIPEGYEGQVRPRSGLAFKYGISIVNTPGTIDADYRGEIKVLILNLGDEDFTVNHGDRIAQMIINPIVMAQYQEQNELPDSSRGEKGFGSTGV